MVTTALVMTNYQLPRTTMGHIRKRTTAQGATRYQARTPNPAAPRKDTMRTFRTRREAERWLTAQAAAMDTGTWLDPAAGATPLRQVATAWQASWADLQPKTRQGYTSILHAHVLPRWGHTPVARIKPDHVQQWLNELAEHQHLAPNTIRRIYSVLAAVLHHAQQTRLIASSPTQAVKLPRKGQPHKPVPLTPAELTHLVVALPEHWQLPTMLVAYTGLRAGELWGLQRQDVTTAPDGTTTLHVQRAVKEVHGHLLLGPTKTHAHRRVTVPAFLARQLQAHLQTIPIHPTAPLFTTPAPHHAPVRHGLFYRRVFAPAAQQALPDHPTPITFHTLRHTHASLLIQEGAPIPLVSRRLGHASTRMTLDTYAHMYPSEEAALAARLDQAHTRAAQAQAQPSSRPHLIHPDDGT